MMPHDKRFYGCNLSNFISVRFGEKFTLENSFCSKAVSTYTIEDKEVDDVLLQKPKQVFGFVWKQLETSFLRCPSEILECFFRRLDKNDLIKCLFICTEFNHIVTPFLVHQARITFMQDVSSFRNNINNILKDIRYPFADFSRLRRVYSPFSHSDPDVYHSIIEVLNTAAKTISSFQSYCVFLVNNSNEVVTEARDTLKILLSVEKARKACLDVAKTDISLKPHTIDTKESMFSSVLRKNNF